MKRSDTVSASGRAKVQEPTMPSSAAKTAEGGGRKVGLTKPLRAAISRPQSAATGTIPPTTICVACSLRRRIRDTRARQQVFQEPMPERQERGAFARFDRPAWTRQIGRDHLRDRRWAVRKDGHAIRQEYGFVDVVG